MKIDIHHNEPKHLDLPKKIRQPMLDCNFRLARIIKKIRLKAQGKTNDEIALIMDIPIKRTRNHLEWVFEKLGVYCITLCLTIISAENALFTSEDEKQDFLNNHSGRNV